MAAAAAATAAASPPPDLQQHCGGTTESAAAAEVLRAASASAVPAVFRGLNAGWRGLTAWADLQYLQQQAGAAPVQAMHSASDIFTGAFEHHQEVSCTFGELLEQAGQQQEQAPRLYLAQQPLQEGTALGRLLTDVPPPQLLADVSLSSTNLWFSSAPSRSSTHYDPYENLLCVVTGSKRVTLHSPAAGLGLYAKPLGGEASNHSSVDFAAPDAQQHPLYRHVQEQGVTVQLHPGDALYIPEGWWHQVDSEGMTFAVNFWWSSQVSTLLQACPHQHHYLLRQLLTAVTGEAVQQLLAGIQPWQQQQQHGAHVCDFDTAGSVPAVGVWAGAAAAQPTAPAAVDAQRPHSELGKRPAGVGSDAADAAAKPGVAAATTPQPAAGGSKRARASSSEAVQPCCLTAFEQAALDALLSDAAAAEAAAGAGAHDVDAQPQHEVATPAQQVASAPEQQQQQQEGQQPSGLLPDAAWWRQQARAQEDLLAAAVAHASCSQGGGGGWALGLHGTAARVLAALQPDQLLRVLWVGATHHPEQVARLLLHGLSPAAAQLLTRGFEAADALFASGGEGAASSDAAAGTAAAGLTQPAFFGGLYSTVPDPAAVLQALLAGKVALWDAAARLVLGAHLGWASV